MTEKGEIVSQEKLAMTDSGTDGFLRQKRQVSPFRKQHSHAII